MKPLPYGENHHPPARQHPGETLLVFYTKAHCWQWRMVSPSDEVFGEQKIYYTASAAEKAGRDWITRGS